jgi:hypothetical protein
VTSPDDDDDDDDDGRIQGGKVQGSIRILLKMADTPLPFWIFCFP